MSSLRTTHNLLRNAVRWGRQGIRPISGKAASGPYRAARPLLLGAVAVGAVGYGAYKLYPQEGIIEAIKNIHPFKVSAARGSTYNPGNPYYENLVQGGPDVQVFQPEIRNIPIKAPSAPPESQPSVFSQTKDHALYLWIHLKPNTSARDVAKVAAKLQRYVDQVVDPKMKDEDDEIWAGVGFGPNFYSQVGGQTEEIFKYRHRKGPLGEMPSSGGDVFIHAKSNQMGKLFKLANCVLRALPKDSVDKYEDIYSFVYQKGRDLSGFPDGTENPADDKRRQTVAVEKETGGSYVITQKWIHDLDLINTEREKTMERWVGRPKRDSTKISRKSISSHVARMTEGTGSNQPKKFEILRQSMPYGTHSGGAGLFFIGYAASPENFEFMLDRMVGAGGDGHSDDIMRLTKNVKGTYWYFPGVEELKNLE